MCAGAGPRPFPSLPGHSSAHRIGSTYRNELSKSPGRRCTQGARPLFGPWIVVAVGQGSGEIVLYKPAADFLHGDDGGLLGRRRQHRTRAGLQLPRTLGGNDNEAVRALLRIVGQGAVSVVAGRFVFSHTSIPQT